MNAQLNKDIIQISYPKKEKKFDIKIYFSLNRTSIIFKAEQIHFFSYYFFKKYELGDFGENYKGIISNKNIKDAFNDIKIIINRHNLRIEKSAKKINLIFYKENGDKDIIFILYKKFISQSKVNKMVIEKIKAHIKNLKEIDNQMNNLITSLNEHNDIIININDKIGNINGKIKIIYKELNDINNALKNSSRKKENSNNKSNNPIANKKKNENINSKPNRTCYFLCLLNIFIIIFISYLFNFMFNVQKKIDISTKQEDILTNKLIYIQDLFSLKKDNEENEENDDNIQYKNSENENIKKNLNIKIISIDPDINLMTVNIRQKEESMKFFEKQIIKIKNNTIKEVNFILKYNKGNSHNDFHINYQTIKENLICFQDIKGNIIYIFSFNFIKLMDEIVKKNKKKLKIAEIYIFLSEKNSEKIYQNEINLINTFEDICDFVNNDGKSNYNGNIKDLNIYEVEQKRQNDN